MTKNNTALYCNTSTKYLWLTKLLLLKSNQSEPTRTNKVLKRVFRELSSPSIWWQLSGHIRIRFDWIVFLLLILTGGSESQPLVLIVRWIMSGGVRTVNTHLQLPLPYANEQIIITHNYIEFKYYRNQKFRFIAFGICSTILLSFFFAQTCCCLQIYGRNWSLEQVEAWNYEPSINWLKSHFVTICTYTALHQQITDVLAVETGYEPRSTAEYKLLSDQDTGS